MSTYILIADDHRVVRDGLREMLHDEADLEIVAEAASGPEALYLAQLGGIDLLILDITLPGFSGVRLLQNLREKQVSIPVLFFSMHPPDQYAAFLNNGGAQGFVSKSADSSEVIAAIRKVIKGGTHFPTLNRKTSRRKLSEPVIDALSDRERAVMLGIIHGNALNEIAQNLGITAKTVGTYRARLLGKLGLNNNAELIAFASRLGLLS